MTLEFNNPEDLNRFGTFFRLILAIPLGLFVSILSGSITPFAVAFGIGGGVITVIVLVHWITVLARGRPVSWAWGTIVGMQRFSLRAYSYFFLLTDRYPPFDSDWYLQFEVEFVVTLLVLGAVTAVSGDIHLTAATSTASRPTRRPRRGSTTTPST